MIGLKRTAKPPDVLVAPANPDRLRRRARWVQRDLDYELKRLEGRKRFGLIWTAGATLAFALLLVPAGWVWSAREQGPEGPALLLEEAARETRILWVPKPLAEIDPDLARAVVAAVDPGFCSGAGSDVALSRKVAEQAFLWRDPSLARDIAAGYLGGLIDLFWSQPRVLEAYLNTARWGDGVIGAEAAAQLRLGRSASDLDRLHHAVPLAAAIDNSTGLRPQGPTPALRQAASALDRQVRELEALGAFGCLELPPETPAVGSGGQSPTG